jgi:hypothetical protein
MILPELRETLEHANYLLRITAVLAVAQLVCVRECSIYYVRELIAVTDKRRSVALVCVRE